MADLSMCMLTAPSMLVVNHVAANSFVYGATATVISKDPWYFTAFFFMTRFIWSELAYHFEDDFFARHDNLLYYTLCFVVGVLGAMFLQTLGNFPRLFNTRSMKTPFETFGEIFDKRYFSFDPILYFVAGQVIMVGAYLVAGVLSDPDCLIVPKATADALGWILIIVGVIAAFITFFWSFFGEENYKIEMRRRIKYLIFLLVALSFGPVANDFLLADFPIYHGLFAALVLLAAWIFGFVWNTWVFFYSTDTDVMNSAGNEVPTQYENALRKTYGAGYTANLAENPVAAAATRRRFDLDGFVTVGRSAAFHAFAGGYIVIGFLAQWLVSKFWIATPFAVFITLLIVTVVYAVLLIILTYMLNVNILRTGSRRTNGASKHVSNNGNGSDEIDNVTPLYNIGEAHPLGTTTFNANTFLRA